MNLLIDADDTLWENITVFNAVNAAYVDWLLPGTHVDDVQAELDKLQIEFIGRLGYGRNTFAESLIAGITRFTNRTPSAADRKTVNNLVRPLHWDTLDLLSGVEQTLHTLSKRNHLIMVTKGDHEEQSHKVARSGLGHFFSAVEILPEKTAQRYTDLINNHELEPSTTWMIGNSPRSDIHPAVAAGIGAIHIPHVETWSHERETLVEHSRILRLNTFADLVQHF